MSKKSITAPSTALPVSGKFYTTAKTERLLYEAFEITVTNGVVESVRALSRAPDLGATAVALCTREIWANTRAQLSTETRGKKGE